MSGLAVAKLLDEEVPVLLFHLRAHKGHCKEVAVSPQHQLKSITLVQELPDNVCDAVDANWKTFFVKKKRIRRSIQPVNSRSSAAESSPTMFNVPSHNVSVLTGNLEVVTRPVLQVIALLHRWKNKVAARGNVEDHALVIHPRPEAPPQGNVVKEDNKTQEVGKVPVWSISCFQLKSTKFFQVQLPPSFMINEIDA